MFSFVNFVFFYVEDPCVPVCVSAHKDEYKTTTLAQEQRSAFKLKIKIAIT